MSFEDKYLAENAQAVMILKKLGMPDEEIQELYDRQVEKDKAEENKTEE